MVIKIEQKEVIIMSRLSYQTKQKREILDFFKLNCDKHITISQISEYFKNAGISISIPTIYRNIDSLVKEGIIKKYAMEGNTAAYFEYIDYTDKHENYYHICCKGCGKLLHFKSEEVQMLDSYFKKQGSVEIDLEKTIFQGTCNICIKKYKKKG